MNLKLKKNKKREELQQTLKTTAISRVEEKNRIKKRKISSTKYKWC